jgi:hypothetical protein
MLGSGRRDYSGNKKIIALLGILACPISIPLLRVDAPGIHGFDALGTITEVFCDSIITFGLIFIMGQHDASVFALSKINSSVGERFRSVLIYLGSGGVKVYITAKHHPKTWLAISQYLPGCGKGNQQNQSGQP